MNPCESARAGATIVSYGPCGDYVRGVKAKLSRLGVPWIDWDSTPGAVSYNVYRKVRVGSEPITDAGTCFISSGIDFPGTFWPGDAGDPLPGEVWLLQVTVMYVVSEGTMGPTTECALREPAERCY